MYVEIQAHQIEKKNKTGNSCVLLIRKKYGHFSQSIRTRYPPNTPVFMTCVSAGGDTCGADFIFLGAMCVVSLYQQNMQLGFF